MFTNDDTHTTSIHFIFKFFRIVKVVVFCFSNFFSESHDATIETITQSCCHRPHTSPTSPDVRRRLRT